MGNRNSPYNLIHQPWIPVIRERVGLDWIAPWQITEGIGGHQGDPVLRLAAPRPDFSGALHEFLIGLLSTCFTPDNEDAWRKYWKTPPSPDDLKQAFAKYEHAFNLDGDGPRFMQTADVLKKKPIPIDMIFLDAPGEITRKENRDHFIKEEIGPTYSLAACAMALITLQTYAKGGGSGVRTSLRGGGPLTTIILPRAKDNKLGGDYCFLPLWAKIWVNVENSISIRERIVNSRTNALENIFPWLDESFGAKSERVTAADAHPLHVYWGTPRRVRLLFREIPEIFCTLTGIKSNRFVEQYITESKGLEYSDGGWFHPLSPYYEKSDKGKTVWLACHGGPEATSYRHWSNYAVGDTKKIVSTCISNFLVDRARVLTADGLQIHCFGYGFRNNAVASCWNEAEMPLRIFENERVKKDIVALTPRLVHSAEYVASQLTGAIKRALFDKPKDAKGDFSHISERFWRETESEFFALLENAKDAIGKAGEEKDVKPALARQWLENVLTPTATRLFDEYASTADIEFKNMERLVEARFSLVSALRGWGTKKAAPGVKLYRLLDIMTPAEQAKKSKQIAEARR